MSRALLWPIFLAGVFAGACSEDSVPLADSGTPLDGSTSGDTGMNGGHDGGSAGDSGSPNGDAGGHDGGNVVGADGGEVDGGNNGGSDGGSGMICQDLAACCATLNPGFLQDRCNRAASSGDTAQCESTFNLIPQCGGNNNPTDAGPPADAGPAGPVCTDLAACCPGLSGLAQNLCNAVANNHDEAACQRTYDRSCVPQPDAGPVDAGPPGPECTDLSMCCTSLSGVAQQYCDRTASGGDENTCQRALGLLLQFGQCGGVVPDAGVVDAGPLGPVCSEYLACCPTLGQLQSFCERSAQRGDEASCGQQLGFAKNAGQCGGNGDGGVADAGLPD